MSRSKFYCRVNLFLVSVLTNFQLENTNCDACSRVNKQTRNMFPPLFPIAALQECLQPNAFWNSLATFFCRIVFQKWHRFEIEFSLKTHLCKLGVYIAYFDRADYGVRGAGFRVVYKTISVFVFNGFATYRYTP